MTAHTAVYVDLRSTVHVAWTSFSREQARDKEPRASSTCSCVRNSGSLSMTSFSREQARDKEPRASNTCSCVRHSGSLSMTSGRDKEPHASSTCSLRHSTPPAGVTPCGTPLPPSRVVWQWSPPLTTVGTQLPLRGRPSLH